MSGDRYAAQPAGSGVFSTADINREMAERGRPLEHNGVRYHAGSVTALQGPGETVLRRQQAGCRGLTGHAGSVLAVGHAGRAQERLREHQGLLVCRSTTSSCALLLRRLNSLAMRGQLAL